MRAPLSITAEQLEDIAQNKVQQQTQQGAGQSRQPISSPKVPQVTSYNKSEKVDLGNWKVPDFPEDVDLQSRRQQAFEVAQAYMNDLLHDDDMRLELKGVEDIIPEGEVVNLETGEVVNRYGGMDILKVYAQNHKAKGLIIDGNV